MESIEEETNSPLGVKSNKFGSKSRILRTSSSIRIEEGGMMSGVNLDTGKISEIVEEKM